MTKFRVQSLSADVLILARPIGEIGKFFIQPFCVIVTFVKYITVIYANEALRDKIQLIELFLKSQEHTKGIVNFLTKEIKNINKNFKKIEPDVALVKNVNNILCKQMVSVERQY